MKFGVYGNCQACDFGACLDVLVPDSKADVFLASDSSRIPDPAEYDIFFAQSSFLRRHPDRRHDNLRLYPTVAFTGFHPDCMYLFPNMKVIRSPLGDYHSSLVASCFILGTPAHEVSSWINAEKFMDVGYFAEFARAKRFLLESALSVGFDLNDRFEEWMKRRIAFVHTINHPAIHVTYDICRLALIKEGLDFQDEISLPQDRLGEAVSWPVYGPVARHLGIAEQPLFKFAQKEAARLGREAMSFDEFVAESYRIYTTLSREVIAEAPPVARVLKAVARTNPR